ncbi:hypothetical protein Lesp02_69740 [Lentzea sp. NBRC 105346]|uniref:anti-sigma factor family protein n=1 Tax=Lentzea sp. NBRC 105346 TaxID=3032205 RepID=UPI0024A0CC6D|nr:zf-HC2 domain-containing protein [Lentzea sp. NBRC 105346]GLZ34787.1 hypothetical protein Lesp02_69740 [Lentzea sp. NBRC 105346]
MTCTHALDVGAYLFGSLDLRERSAFERHLGGCDTCRAEMLRLAPLPGLLGRLTPDDVENLDDLPTVAPKPRKRRLLLATAIAVVVALATVVVLLRPSPGPTWAASDANTGVSASAQMITRSWGTEIRLSLHDVPLGSRCKLLVHDKKGQREIGGWWGTSTADGETVPGSTSFQLDAIDHMEVMVDDRILVTLKR